MHPTQGIKAIILMGGIGERFGSKLPKQFHRLGGKKVYEYTVEAFLTSKAFEEILLVCHPEWEEELTHTYTDPKIRLVHGGTTRQESSLKGLLACGENTRIVVIHDAVRPFVSQRILEQNILYALKYGAVDTCIPSSDTLVYAPEGAQISSIPQRAHYMRGQTPQSFAYPLILNAHLNTEIQNSSDDCSLVAKHHPIQIVQGSEENIKITSELDLFLAEQLLRLKSATPLKPSTCLKGKKIAVTGGSGGIGSQVCALLEEEGATAINISRSQSPYATDLTHFDSTKSTFDRILQEIGPLDGLINSIGLLKTRPIDALTSEEIDALIATNLTSVIYSCKCAHLNPGAHIINIASSSYTRGRKNMALYSSAKAAIVNFSQALAEEREDLQVNVLIPQRTNTPMRTHNFPDENCATLLCPSKVAQEIIALLKVPSLTGSLIEVKKK